MQIANMGNYAHGNQPIQHMIYLYNYAGQPWKTQKHIREVLTRLYAPTPDGYCGDEDNGQTSAWYVFSSLGFYPVAPATNQYVLGSPLFNEVTLRLQNGNTFKITADSNAISSPYIQSATLNGMEYHNTFLTSKAVQDGGTLHFKMGTEPNKDWATTTSARPFSLSNTDGLDMH